jgi:hypothetical protein
MQNWQAQKEALLNGLTGSKREIVSTLMENQHALMETAGGTNAMAGDIGNFQKIAIPMIRRIIPGTIATDLVGVQPLSGPVGLVFSTRFVAKDVADAGGVLTANDIAVGDELFGNSGKMKRFYSSANVGTTGYPPALTAATTDGFGATTANYEGFGGKAMAPQVLKQTVTAYARKMQARWTTEAATDMKSQHGIDIEAEMVAHVSATIAAEIDNEILTDLMSLAGSTSTFDFANPTAGFAPNSLADRYAHLGVLINKHSNEIGAKVRKGQANWLVGSHFVTSMLQSASKAVFAPTAQGSYEAPSGNRKVGRLNGTMDVYSYNWGLDDAWTIGGGASSAVGATGENILIGYKDGNSELGAGYFYCPYVPLVATGVVTDPNTFTQAVSLSTRYGKAYFTDTATSLGNSSDFYCRLLVKNVAFS